MACERVERRLAAVLAADVAGYSRLMGVDEEGTLARLKAVRKTLVDPTIANYRGRIVKTTGDGMLVEFASAVMRYAVPLKSSAVWPSRMRLYRRTKGSNFGSAFTSGTSSLMITTSSATASISPRGLRASPSREAVRLSDDTYRQVRGKVEIACDDMGPQALKNIAEPMRAWRVRGQSALQAQSGSPASQAPRSRCLTSPPSRCCRSRT